MGDGHWKHANVSPVKVWVALCPSIGKIRRFPVMRINAILPVLLLSTARLFAGEATPADQLKVPPGFKVELLRSAGDGEGSWSSMAVDDKGRLYISPQGTVPGSGFGNDSAWGGLWRVTLDTKGQIAAWDKVPVPVGDSMGMLWAFNSLYVSGQGPEGRGIYRLKDTNGDDTLDAAPLWKAVAGGNGEHGAHALVVGPDGKSLYIAHGNSTPLVEGVDPKSAYRDYAEDVLIPRVMDPVATFFDKLKIPYGYVLKTDENGTKWELMAGGFRNQYDIDFNAEGELFTYDSDMEWDAGLPWYRPTRVLHVVPGGEYGFREGNQKWPEYYQDSLPASVDVGFGCPTGVKFGTKSNYPEKYRRAFFIMDWTFGRLLAVHLTPKGSTYTAGNPLKSYTYPKGPESSDDVEVFLSGKGMPLTDLEFGKDGAMYFTVGGRGTQGGLYRVSYTGTAASTPASPDTVKEHADRVRAAKIESVSPGTSPGSRRSWRLALELAGSNAPLDRVFLGLGDEDRFVRNAARVLLESMPSARWKEKALAQADARTALTALLGLARVGEKEDQAPLLKALAKFPLDSLDEELKLLKLRVIKVSFVRQGRPDPDIVNLAIEKLGKQYPAKSWPLNRELSELLVWLGAPDAVEKTLGLLESSKPQEEQIWYACMLREAQNWTPAHRERYFSWFPKAHALHGGNSFAKFIERVKDQGLARVPDAERGPLAEIASKAPPAPAPFVPVVVRQFQKAWTIADFDGEFAKVAKGRNLARGKEIYASTQCASCHHFGTEGGNIGPDLTGVGGRFQPRDILEAIIDPSKAISEQYASFVFTMKDGQMAVGQVANETNFYYDIIEDPIRGAHRQVGKSNLAKKEVNPVSLMPPGLINVLTKDEVLDLLAYLTSGVPKQ
jgi:putative heme-binding domain-containing protein